MRFLVDLFVDRHGALYSDEAHTDDAQRFWKALINMPGNLTISVVDLDTGKKVPAQNGPDPWDDTSTTRLLAEQKMSLREWADKWKRHRALTGRETTWYLISGSERYPNP